MILITILENNKYIIFLLLKVNYYRPEKLIWGKNIKDLFNIEI